MKRGARCWAEIDRSALRHNVAALRKRLGGLTRILAVVKADGYGHGAREVVRALSGHVEMLGVADVNEALDLRPIAARARILILGTALADEREEIVRSRFLPTISSLEEALSYAAIHRDWRSRTAAPTELAAHEPFQVHLDIDTGMGRIGVWQEEAPELVREIIQVPDVILAGISTHLPVADEDAEFTVAQLGRFAECLERIERVGLRVPMVHALNSAGTIRFSKHARDFVRAGLALYGSSPIPDFQPELRPVMTWKTRVTLIRDVGHGRGVSYGRTFITPRPMRIAVLAAGYADGYPRHLSGKQADVLIRGRRCAVLGRITMDQTMVDVSGVPEAVPGDEVVLMGKQDGEEILAAELAEKAGTIAWEIFTGITKRVERVGCP